MSARPVGPPVGLALCGTGGIARRFFVPAIRQVPQARLAAVLSRDLARGRAFADEFEIPHAHDSLESLLEDTTVQAVIVASPDGSHETQVIAAARAGLHVLCEKPMAPTSAACERMAATVAQSGVTFAMGYSFRFLNSLRSVAQLLQARRLGPVRFARARFTSKVPASADPWRNDPCLASSWVMSRIGTHLLDLFRWWFGEPDAVQGIMVAPRDGGPHEELAVVVATFPGGLVAELVVSVLVDGGNGLDIYGEEGILTAENVFRYSPEPASIVLNGSPIACEQNDVFAEEIADFVGAILSGRAPRTGVDDGVRNVWLMEQARQGRTRRGAMAPGSAG